MWYLSIKNWLIIILLVVGVAASGLFLWERITVVKQKDTIGDLQTLTADLQGQVKDYKANIAVMKKVQQDQQKVENDTAVLLTELNKLLGTKCLEAKDEEANSHIIHYFNTHGVLTPSSTETSGEVLPKTN